MPNPKRRHSKSRRDKRRANYRVSPPSIVLCPRCHERKLSHHVCPNCGYYGGKEIIETE